MSAQRDRVTAWAVGAALAAMGSVAAPAAAQSLLGPVAAALGGAYTARATGPDAAVWDPAFLALPGAPHVGLNLGSMGAAAHTNGISLDLYNRASGSFLDDALKADILRAIPAEGLDVAGRGEGAVAGLSVGPVAVAAHASGAGSVRVPRDVADLVLYGNTLGRTYDFGTVGGGGLATAGVIVGAAIRLPAPRGIDAFALGVSVEDIVGARAAEVVGARGTLITTPTALGGEGMIDAWVGKSGRGLGVSVGLGAVGGKTWRAGIVLRSLGSVRFGPGTLYHETFHADSVNVYDSFDRDFVTTTSDSLPAPARSIPLPTALRAGVARRVGALMASADVTIGLRASPGNPTGREMAAGLELWPDGILRLRAGMGAGGPLGTRFAAGLGLAPGPLRIDVAAIHVGGPSAGATRGVGAAAGFGLRF